MIYQRNYVNGLAINNIHNTVQLDDKVQIKKSLADQIQEEIKNRIMNLEIQQGDKIDVPELEEEFGVSRAPIRDALQSLADQGLVKVKPRVGYFAIELTAGQIKDICEMRKVLEEFALTKSIFNIPKPEVEKIREETLRLKENNIPQNQLRDEFDKTDEELHRKIIVKANNEFLVDFTERIHTLIGLTRHLNDRIDVAIEEHLEILDAMLVEDLERARRQLSNHLEQVEREVLEDNLKRAEPRNSWGW